MAKKDLYSFSVVAIVLIIAVVAIVFVLTTNNNNDFPNTPTISANIGGMAYTTSNTPSGYGTPYDPGATIPFYTLSATNNGVKTNITLQINKVGSFAKMYTYSTAYYTTGASWVPITLSTSTWIPDSFTGSIQIDTPSSTQEYNIIIYTCKKYNIGDQYYCGYSNTIDTTKKSWTVQNINIAPTTQIIPITINSVTISPSTASINTGAQTQFTAQVSGTGTYTNTVTWSALRGTISSSGLYTAPSTAGSDTVTAKSTQDTTKSASASVTVGVAGAGPVISNVVASTITTTGVTISWSLNKYGTGQVSYGTTSAYGSLSTPENSLTYNAHIQTLSGLTPSTLYHFSIRSCDGTNFTGSCTTSTDYTFTTASSTTTTTTPTISSVSISPSTTSINTGAQTQFTAQVSGTGTYINTVTWSALRGTITNSGMYTAPTTTGSDTITARSTQDNTKLSTASVTVSTYVAPSGSLNVKNYGATGNGNTDDTDAFQNAINALSSGGTLVVPDGTYMIDAAAISSGGTHGLEISGKSNINIVLSSGATLKAITNSEDGYQIIRIINSDHVNINGGTLLGDKDTHTGSSLGEYGMCLAIYGSTYVVLDGTAFRKCHGDGIYIERTGSGTITQHVIARNIIADGNYRMGFSVVDGDDIILEDSTITNTGGLNGGGAGIDLEPNAGETVNNIQILRNTITNNVATGIGGGGRYLDGAITTNVVVANNTVISNGMGGIYFNDGSDGTLITNNLVINNIEKGIALSTIATNTKIIGNNVTGTSGTGILLEDCDNTIINGNYVTGSTGRGIDGRYMGSGVTFNNNYVWNNGQASTPSSVDTSAP